MEKLLEHLRNIWTIFQQAPLEFIILLILAFLAAWYVADFIYKERIETLKQQIDNLKQSIETLNLRANARDAETKRRSTKAAIRQGAARSCAS
jgi:hypothetical protein